MEVEKAEIKNFPLSNAVLLKIFFKQVFFSTVISKNVLIINWATVQFKTNGTFEKIAFV